MEWEQIDSHGNCEIYRAKVWQGWLVKSKDISTGGSSITYLGDRKYEWVM